AEAARGRDGLAEERRADVADGRGGGDAVEEVLGRHRQRHAPSAFTAASAALPATSPAPAQSPAAQAAPAPSGTSSRTSAARRRFGGPTALEGDGLAEPQVHDHEAGADAEVARDDRLARRGPRVEQAVWRVDDVGLVRARRVGRTVGEDAVE